MWSQPCLSDWPSLPVEKQPAQICPVSQKHLPSTTQRSTTWQIFISSVTMILHQMKSCHLWRPVLLLPFLWMTLQTSQWSQILQIKFCRKQSAYVVLSNDKYAGNFHNANCLHIIHKGALSKPNWKVPILLSFYRLPVPASF